MDDRNKENIQQLLKKIQNQTPQQKRLQALKILEGQNTTKSSLPSWFSRFMFNKTKIFQNNKKFLFQQIRNHENRHIALITVFFIGAGWINWKIQDKYDKMKKIFSGSKSQKQIEIERESRYIQKMLQKNPFEPVPIQQQQAENNEYLFQKADYQYDTSADLYDAMQKQTTSSTQL